MRSLLLMALCSLTAHLYAADITDLYVNTFGNKANQAVIFVHGGPGFNSQDFEATTAQALADKGYFVVTYDQRGQGRSKASSADQITYQVYADDIKSLIEKYELNQPILIGHSHGGPISMAFDQIYPGVAQKIVLVSAPVDFWGAMQSLFENCASRYAADANENGVLRIAFVKMKLAYEYDDLSDADRVAFVSDAFGHGLFGCKLYSTRNPTTEAIELRKKVKQIPDSQIAMPGFLKNENYIHKNFVDHVFAQRDRYCGIYGDEDGLFTPLSLAVLKNILNVKNEPSRFALVKGASHGLYIDQQSEFFKVLASTCGI